VEGINSEGRRWPEREWAGTGRTGPVGPNSKEGLKIELIFEFEWISDFANTLGICKRRFRRNLDMGIFPKIF
jgi:hypothetical protein